MATAELVILTGPVYRALVVPSVAGQPTPNRKTGRRMSLRRAESVQISDASDVWNNLEARLSRKGAGLFYGEKHSLRELTVSSCKRTES
jgi:hypothetical protein